MKLISERTTRINTENAFKVGPYIAALEEAGNKVVKCNLGEPDFPLPVHIRDEVKRQLDLDNVHYTNPQGVPSLRKAVAQYIGDNRGLEYSPEQVVVGDMDNNGADDVIGDFGVDGIFVKRNLGAWVQLHNINPEDMTIGNLDGTAGDDLVVDVGVGDAKRRQP